MKKLLFILSLFILILNTSLFSQNVGIGTTAPTNTLHVIVNPTNPNPNPVRFEGIQRYTTEDSVLVVNPATGVVKYMPMADVLSNIPPNVLDSLVLNSVLNNTDTIYNNQSVRDSIIAIAMSNSDTLFSTQTFRDSVLGTVLSNMDTIFTITRDSLLTDSTFINTLRDSIDTDIDSVTFANDTIYIYENGTVVQTYINTSLDTALIDSLILASSDTLYSIISDSLTNDTNWIKQIDSLLSIYGDTIYFNDSSFTLIRDSLLNDSLFMDSLISLIGDSIDTDIDSVVLIGDTLHIYEDGVDATADISGVLDSIRTVDSLFTPDYVIFADSNGRLSEDTVKHFKTVINNQGDRALLLNTDSIINTGNSNWSQLQAFHKAASYESVVSLEDGYIGLSMAGQSVPVLHLENRGGTFSVTQPIDTSIEDHRATGTIIFLGKDSTASRGTQATIQGTSKFYDNQSLLTGFLFTGRTRTTPANPKLTLGYNFPHFHNNSELLFELNNDGNGSIQAHFYKDSRNDTTPVNNFLYTDANGVFQSKSVDTLIQLMRDSLDDADWNINANGTGLEAAPAGNNVASGQYAISAGFSDTATGQYSAIVGGYQNKATGSYSSVTGGYQNLAQGSYSTVGGYRDTATGSYGAVLAGRENKISGGFYTTVSGGYRNKLTNSSYGNVSGYLNTVISSSYASVHGYQNYVESSNSSVLVFGHNDSAVRSVQGTFIAGENNSSIAAPGGITGLNTILGTNNKIYVPAASGSNSHTHSILGGSNNIIEGSPAPGDDKVISIVGATGAKVLSSSFTNYRSAIFGGVRDTLNGTAGSVLLGGNGNKIYNGGGWHAVVGGNFNKVQQQWFSGVYSGWRNSVNNSHSSVIVAGWDNTLMSGNNKSVILGGDTNIVNNGADNTIILSGRGNTANNFGQTVLGHFSTNTVPTGSSASAIDPDNIILKIGNGTDASNLSDAMVVKANGNVGIGVFNPSEALEVSGNILASGTITPSDERYKTNITPLDNALTNLLKLRGVSYEMKNEYKNKGFGDGLQIGVIAQEVEKIYPELIQTNKQTGYKGVDYSKFTPILIEAVKEQQDIINTNKEEIKSLKTENEALKERLNKLEEALNTILEK